MRSKFCMHFLSLTGGASRWYYSLDPSKTKVWNELVEFFVNQFIFNTMIDVTVTTKSQFWKSNNWQCFTSVNLNLSSKIESCYKRILL